MGNNFVAFILTHGRPDKVKTYKTLKKSGYTGRIVLVVDNEDDTVDEYRKRYGDKVVVFDKLAISKKFDTADLSEDRRTAVYARNACFEIAEDLGVEYFIQLDDDYTSFVYKFNSRLEFIEKPIKSLDKVWEAMLRFYKSIPALTLAMAQNGDFIGGKKSGYAEKLSLRRKAMNSFICSTKRPFKFIGRINEDVNTYVRLGSMGKLILTVPNISLIQTTTQSSAGGMTDVYLGGGTYLKSFFTVMYHPSSVVVAEMGDKHMRLHHRISWKNTVPVIMHEDYKKSERKQ